jgi:ornithine carbamoyltransferase
MRMWERFTERVRQTGFVGFFTREEPGLFEHGESEVDDMWQRFTERARRVIFFAQEEAARYGENYVGTEHVLLGLIRESESVAARILDRMDIGLGRIRNDLEHQMTRGRGNLGQDMQLTPRAKRVIDLAYEEARQFNNDYVGTEHVLLGLIREGDGLAARVLIQLGATLDLARIVTSELQTERGTDAAAQSTPLGEAKIWSRLRALVTLARGTEAGTAGPQALELLETIDAEWKSQTPHTDTNRLLEVAVGATRVACQGLTDFRAITDLSPIQAEALLQLASFLKLTIKQHKDAHMSILSGKTLAMIFEKPSLRTRVSFETGMFQLGGHAIYLQPSDISMGKRETVADTARNLERMVDGIMARVFAHSTILELAEHSNVPVINGLCDREHPCQALADLQTVIERKGSAKGLKIAYIGDGNNVAHSLMLLGAKLGAHVVVACPPGYEPLPEVGAEGLIFGAQSGGSVSVTHDPREACTDADVLYTDVWASMGQEAEAAERAKIFAPFQVNEELAALAKPDYLFLHCLPAHRGEEVSAGVMDGPNSIVFDQAENRLHAQKAVLAVLLGGSPAS